MIWVDRMVQRVKETAFTGRTPVPDGVQDEQNAELHEGQHSAKESGFEWLRVIRDYEHTPGMHRGFFDDLSQRLHPRLILKPFFIGLLLLGPLP